MLSWLKTKADERHKARELYGAVVAQARLPVHFTHHGAADTPEGRYEMIVLHVALVIDRLLAEGEAGRRLAQRLNEAFVTDMDDAMREMGVGDLTVPKKVKKAAGGLYDRFEAYRAVSKDGTGAQLEALLTEVLTGSHGDPAGARPLAIHVGRLVESLAKVPAGRLLAGELPLPVWLSGNRGAEGGEP